MTQALALASILRKKGHEVTRVIVGRSERRTIPDFFVMGIGCEIEQVESPNFITDKDNKSVKIWGSIFQGFRRLGIYRKSIKRIDEIVSEEKPDVIINFYDFIGGIYNRLKKPKAKFYCIAHQYLARHTSFEFAQGRLLDRNSLNLGNWLTAFGADTRLALSFQEFRDEPGLVVVPPLLREEVTNLEPTDEGHVLVYMLNHGYAEEVDRFHAAHPKVKLHCFWDKSDAPKKWNVDETLTYHQLDGELFLKMMATCRGFLTTAGFESVCEAMYLGKPVLMMPVKGHYEQVCNALDAEKAGAGISSDTFDLKLLVDYIPKHKSVAKRFQLWSNRAEEMIVSVLTR